MVQHEAPQLHPLLRDGAPSFVPQLTDDQLVRIARSLAALNPDTLVSRMTDFTALVQGFLSKPKRRTKPTVSHGP